MNYNEALQLATKMHKGQFRRDGLEYISHPITVADKFEDEKYKIVAVLHDVIEDTDVTLSDLYGIGLSAEIVSAINMLTRKSYQTYLDYILLCATTKMTREIKIEDIKHNMLGNPTICGKDKYIMALYILSKNEKH